MPANNNGFQFVADLLNSLLTPEDQADLDRYCLKRPTKVAVKSYLDELRREYKERGIDLPQVCQRSVDAWFDSKYKPAAAAIAIHSRAEQYAGLDGDALVRLSAGMIVEYLKHSNALLSQPGFVHECKPETVIHNTMAGLKELRQIGVALKNQEETVTKRALERSGAYRLAEIVRQLVKDQRFETEVIELLTAALIQHDSET